MSRIENRPAKEDLAFGTTISDHMLMVEWEKEGGWKTPRIVPYQDLKISPAASSLHYGTLHDNEPREYAYHHRCFVLSSN